MNPTSTKAPQSARPEAASERAHPAERAHPPFRWGFLSAALTILGLMATGHVVCDMVMGALADLQAGRFPAKNWIFCAFLLSSAVLLFLQRAAVRRFLLDMHVGVSLVGWSIVAVTAGVLVPQMDGFEDPTNRITAGDWEAQYQRFADAEAYFLYHLTHIYGIGMPSAQVPPGVDERLEVFGRKYGREEEHNRRKQMKSAFAGMAKREEIEAWKQRHDGFLRGFFKVATALHLNRAYKSYWFATLMALVCASVIMNLFRTRGQKWFTVAKAGFAVTHLGVATILIGGMWSKMNEDRGILQLFLDRPPERDYLRHFDPQKISRLPFWVRLERFARLDWKQLEIGFADAGFSSQLPTYTLWNDRRIELDFVDDGQGGLRPRVALRVIGLHEHARVNQFKLSEAGPGEEEKALGPIAVLDVPDYYAMFQANQRGASNEEVLALRSTAHLVPDYPGAELWFGPAWRFAPLWEYRLKSMRAEKLPMAGDSIDLAALFGREDLLGHLHVRDLAAGEVETQRVPVRLGSAIETSGGYRIEVKEATARYETEPGTGVERRDARPIHEQVPWNPGLWVEITPPQGGDHERRLVLESVDAEGSAGQAKYANKDLLLKLEWERWTTPGPPRYVLAWGKGREALLVDETGQVSSVRPGDVLPLPGSSERKNQVRVEQLLANAHAQKDIEFLPRRVGPDGFDESFYIRDPRGLELEIVLEPGTPEESVEVVRMATSTRDSTSFANHWVSPDQRFYIHFFENDRAFPFEWRSVLSIYEEDPEGRWHLHSGQDGRLLESLSAGESARYRAQIGVDVRQVADADGDRIPDFIGPVRRVDLGSDRKREIRVNDYFAYRGYRFFQTNADPNAPSYSGIGVVYDPGIPTVLFGMYTVIAGTILAFIVRPIVQSRKKRMTA